MAKAKTSAAKVPAKKAVATKVAAKKPATTAKSASKAVKGAPSKAGKTVAKYEQTGAPWWKRVPLPDGK